MSNGMPKSSFFLWCCPNPINFDTYDGCSHRCAYCFTNFRNPAAKGKFAEVKRGSTAASLRKWIDGGRGAREKWVAPDWRIPICWGRNSDPFQPKERETGWSLECLRVFAETKYPFIVTTKSVLPAEGEYAELFAQCNCVLQMSMVGPFMDKMEKGAPPYEERLKAVEKLSKIVPRVIARWQPFFVEPWTAGKWRVEMERQKDAGVYGILAETASLPMKQGHCCVRVGKLYRYGENIRDIAFRMFREKAHELGLRFYCGAQRFSDSVCCCGTDGLGWEHNQCTVAHKYLDPEHYAVRDSQKVAGTGCAFKNCHTQSCKDYSFMEKSFQENVEDMFTKDYECVCKTGYTVENYRKSLAGKGGVKQ